MTITRLHAGPRMSQAVIHGSTVYLAGQVGGKGFSVHAEGDQFFITREAGGRVIAVGTTVVRTLESATPPGANATMSLIGRDG